MEQDFIHSGAGAKKKDYEAIETRMISIEFSESFHLKYRAEKKLHRMTTQE